MTAAEPSAPWLAVAGKGGAGKSVITGTLARVLARRGHRVLAIDSDPMPGLARSLGIEDPSIAPLTEAVERPEGQRWRLKPGIGPARAVARFTTPGPDGIRMLQLGKADRDGRIPDSVHGFLPVVQRLHEPLGLRSQFVIGDLPAGPRHPAAGFSAYARLYVIIVEAGSQSALTARRVAKIAREHRGADVLIVANKVRDPDSELARIERLTGERAELVIPFDPAVAAAERDGVALLDAAPSSPAVQAIEELADAIERRRLVR